ncbi:MAG TPA: thermostable hemolysin, partial [Burkholderiales bacterium]|nr:thermostable hemolysin [Burkholderiales bacterium]
MLKALLQPDGLHRGEIHLPAGRRSEVSGKHFNVGFSGPDAEDRKEIERFIFDSFSQSHGAHVHHFMPQLLTLRGGDGKLFAACGLRIAGSERLFLEAYLDEPIDEVISRKTGKRVGRADIVEIGNLAGFTPGIGRRLIAVLAAHL